MNIVEIVDKVNAKLGKGTVRLLGSDERLEIDVIPTGSFDLDAALGVGGWPRGRFIEISGREASGKTTLCLEAIRQAQALDIPCAFIDMEQALDPAWVKTCGVNADDLAIVQPNSGEQAFRLIEQFAIAGAGLVVVDSIAAMVPEEEMSAEFSKARLGSQARMMSAGLRKLGPTLKKNNTSVIFLNQFRIDIMKHMGDKRTTSGGEAMKFYSSVRVWINAAFKAHVKKNKVAAPYKNGRVMIDPTMGLDNVACLIEGAKRHKIITTAGAYHRFAGYSFQGMERLRTALDEDEEMLYNLYQAAYDAVGLPLPEVIQPPELEIVSAEIPQLLAGEEPITAVLGEQLEPVPVIISKVSEESQPALATKNGGSADLSNISDDKLFAMLETVGLITKSGAWYWAKIPGFSHSSYKGRAAAVEMVAEERDACEKAYLEIA